MFRILPAILAMALAATTPALADDDDDDDSGFGLAGLLSGDNKNPRRRIFERSFENPPLRFP